jgi:hypothetical protein
MSGQLSQESRSQPFRNFDWEQGAEDARIRSLGNDGARASDGLICREGSVDPAGRKGMIGKVEEEGNGTRVGSG